MLYNGMLTVINHGYHPLTLSEFIKYWAYVEQKTTATTIVLQLFGIAAWIAAVSASADYSVYSSASLLGYAAGLMASTVFILYNDHILFRLFGKLIYFIFLSQALASVILSSADSTLWSLATSSLIVVGMSPLFHEPITFLCSAAIVKFVMLFPHLTEISASIEFSWMVCFIVSALIFSIAINYLFFMERVSVYASQRKLVEMAYTDSLTNISNRRAFLHSLERVIAQAKANKDLFLMLIDVDDFKSVNDSNGHDVGDDVLCEIARRIEAIASPQCCGRLGGEEFGVFLVGHYQDAEIMAQTLNDAIALKPIHTLKVTISIGVTKMNERTMTVSELLGEADRQLYLAKKAGKNQFSISSAESVLAQASRRAKSGANQMDVIESS